MKKSLFSMLLIAFLPVIAQGQSVEEESQKTYIEPSQLIFENRGMFVYLAGAWVPVNAVYSDGQGFYVKPLVTNYPYTRWICKCGYNNYGGDETCQRVDYNTGRKCGRPRPQ